MTITPQTPRIYKVDLGEKGPIPYPFWIGERARELSAKLDKVFIGRLVFPGEGKSIIVRASEIVLRHIGGDDKLSGSFVVPYNGQAIVSDPSASTDSQMLLERIHSNYCPAIDDTMAIIARDIPAIPENQVETVARGVLRQHAQHILRERSVETGELLTKWADEGRLSVKVHKAWFGGNELLVTLKCELWALLEHLPDFFPNLETGGSLLIGMNRPQARSGADKYTIGVDATLPQAAVLQTLAENIARRASGNLEGAIANIHMLCTSWHEPKLAGAVEANENFQRKP